MWCSVCRNEIKNSEPLFLFYSPKKNTSVYCCDECEKQLNILMTTYKSSAFNQAIDYFYACINICNDDEIKDYLLRQVADNNTRIAKGVSVDKQEPVSEPQNNCTESKKESIDNFSFWISSSRFFARLLMIAIIIAGIIISVPFFNKSKAGEAFLIIVLSIVLAIASCSAYMVFLDMASDLKYIRNKLAKK